MSKGKIVLGLAAGLAAGAILGILFAPQKGTRTRKRLFRKGEKAVDEVKDKMDDLFETLSDKLDAVKSDVTEYMFEKGKKKAEEVGKNSVKA